MKFNIKEDLQTRPLADQAEILWISGPTWHNAARICQILGISEERLVTLLDQKRRTK